MFTFFLKSFYLATIILPIVLYWFETWSLILREERKLKVSENKALRRMGWAGGAYGGGEGGV
jgi:hypothetical protein